MLFRVIRGAFSQRRKTILNCLASAFGREKSVVQGWLTAAGVSPAARAEALTLPDFARIADSIT
jgi:16S rRNA (adenine1518-N6/adenine1519-N6)-dimethyltransferase